MPSRMRRCSPWEAPPLHAIQGTFPENLPAVPSLDPLNDKGAKARGSRGVFIIIVILVLYPLGEVRARLGRAIRKTFHVVRPRRRGYAWLADAPPDERNCTQILSGIIINN